MVNTNCLDKFYININSNLSLKTIIREFWFRIYLLNTLVQLFYSCLQRLADISISASSVHHIKGTVSPGENMAKHSCFQNPSRTDGYQASAIPGVSGNLQRKNKTTFDKNV